MNRHDMRRYNDTTAVPEEHSGFPADRRADALACVARECAETPKNGFDMNPETQTWMQTKSCSSCPLSIASPYRHQGNLAVELLEPASSASSVSILQSTRSPPCATSAHETKRSAAEKAVLRGDGLGLLHGLPTGIKDLDETGGLLTTFGSPLYRDFVPERDNAMVARVRAAGAIVVGKTNVPEFGAGANSRNFVWGATGNPFDPHAQRGRFFGRLRGRARDRHAAGLHGLRYRRLATYPGREMRRRRLSSFAGSRARRAALARLDADLGRGADGPHRRRHVSAAWRRRRRWTTAIRCPIPSTQAISRCRSRAISARCASPSPKTSASRPVDQPIRQVFRDKIEAMRHLFRTCDEVAFDFRRSGPLLRRDPRAELCSAVSRRVRERSEFARPERAGELRDRCRHDARPTCAWAHTEQTRIFRRFQADLPRIRSRARADDAGITVPVDATLSRGDGRQAAAQLLPLAIPHLRDHARDQSRDLHPLRRRSQGMPFGFRWSAASVAPSRPRSRSIRMSSGPSVRKLIPRAASSSCIELSADVGDEPVDRVMPSAARCGSISEKRRGRSRTRSPKRASRARASASARASRSTPMTRVPGHLEDAPRRGRRAERRVDVDAALARRERAHDLVAQHGDVRLARDRGGGGGQAHGDDVLDVHRRNCSAMAVLKLCELRLATALAPVQRSLRPELGRPPHARPEHVLRELGVLAERRRDEDAPLLVELALDGRREVHAAGTRPRSARTAASRRSSPRALPRRASGRGGGTGRRARGVRTSAEVVRRGEHVAKARREARAPLRVDCVLELTAEHRAPSIPAPDRPPGRSVGWPGWPGPTVGATVWRGPSCHFFPREPRHATEGGQRVNSLAVFRM